MSAERPYQDPFFCVALPGQRPAGAEFSPRHDLSETLFQAIESSLMDTSRHSASQALNLQLDYALTLAKVGYPDRSEEHFIRVLGQIRAGRGSLDTSTEDGGLQSMESEAVSRDKALWYATSAKVMSDAGFIELADETLTRSKEELLASFGIEGDEVLEHRSDEEMLREIAESNATIDVILIFIELQQYETAEHLLSTVTVNGYNYSDFLEAESRLAAYYEEVGETDKAEVFREEMRAMIKDLKGYLEDQLDEDAAKTQKDEDQLDGDNDDFEIYKTDISKLIIVSKRYGLEIDHVSLLTHARRAIDEVVVDPRAKNDYYCFLAMMHHVAGNKEESLKLLEEAIIVVRHTAIDDMEYAFKYLQVDLGKIAMSYALIGEFDYSEVLRGDLPNYVWTSILFTELDYANEKGDDQLINETIKRIEANLADVTQTASAEEFEQLNPYAMELLFMYAKQRRYDDMAHRFNAFIESQEGDLIDSIDPEEFSQLADIFYTQGRILEAFKTLRLSDSVGKSKFLIKLLSDVNTNQDWTDNFSQLAVVADQLRRYSRELPVEGPAGLL